MKNTSGIFIFDPNDLIYNDHFPSNPVVPGSQIIHSFLNAIIDWENISGNENMNFGIREFRFIRLMRPGKYNFTIEKDQKCYKCLLYENKKITASGKIIL